MIKVDECISFKKVMSHVSTNVMDYEESSLLPVSSSNFPFLLNLLALQEMNPMDKSTIIGIISSSINDNSLGHLNE